MSPLAVAFAITLILTFTSVLSAAQTPPQPPIDEQLTEARRLYDERQIERADALFRDALQRAEQQHPRLRKPTR